MVALGRTAAGGETMPVSSDDGWLAYGSGAWQGAGENRGSRGRRVSGLADKSGGVWFLLFFVWFCLFIYCKKFLITLFLFLSFSFFTPFVS